MENEDKNKIQEYIKSLPKNVQDFMYEGIWEERTLEIGKKYSLNEKQAGDLADMVSLVLLGIESPEAFLTAIKKDLGLSDLLIEQILKDLASRVFEYALNFVENKDKNKSAEIKKVVVEPEVKKKEPPAEQKLPELAPNILPVVEKNEPVKIVNVPPAPVKYAPTYDPNNKSQFGTSSANKTWGPSHINYTTTKPVGDKIEAEIVQQPVSVPRFVAKSENVAEETPTMPGDEAPQKAEVVKTPVTTNPIDSKLSGIVTKTAEKEVQKPAHEYVADPYREPIQ